MIMDYRKYDSYKAEAYPVRHRKKDLSRIEARIDLEYKRKILDIRDMDAQLGNYILGADDYVELVSEAHSVNVHWSTHLEGNPLSLDEVRKSSRRMMTSKEVIIKDPGPAQEIMNHLYFLFAGDMFLLPWHIETIEDLHRILMTGTGEDCSPGTIRTKGEEMGVYTEDGTESFIACPGVHVRNELGALLDWIDISPYDPLVTAVVFFHEFESIHPFTEGNGRVGRTLFHILMQELGLENFGLCRLEDKLLAVNGRYYSLMEYTDAEADYTPLCEFFTDCILEAYDEAIREFSAKDVLKGLDENARTIALEARAEGDWFSVSDAREWVGGVGEQTVRARLSDLTGMKVLEKDGLTRATRYRFRDPFEHLRTVAAKAVGIHKDG